MATEKNTTAQEQAHSMIRIQGIIATIFGSLGTLLGFVLMIIFAFALTESYGDETIEILVYFVASVLFVFIPHIYLIVSGVLLMRKPNPKLARILTIINLIVGAMSNYVILAFAIISLTQVKDYEDGYGKIK